MIAQLSDEQRQAVLAGTPLEIRDGEKGILNAHVVIEHFVDFGSQRIHFVIRPRTVVIFPEPAQSD